RAAARAARRRAAGDDAGAVRARPAGAAAASAGLALRLGLGLAGHALRRGLASRLRRLGELVDLLLERVDPALEGVEPADLLLHVVEELPEPVGVLDERRAPGAGGACRGVSPPRDPRWCGRSRPRRARRAGQTDPRRCSSGPCALY